jgi:hypothetical protein
VWPEPQQAVADDPCLGVTRPPQHHAAVEPPPPPLIAQVIRTEHHYASFRPVIARDCGQRPDHNRVQIDIYYTRTCVTGKGGIARILTYS